MKPLIALLVLLVVALSVEAAAPVISCTPNRTSGTAPLGVFLDCTGTTDADTTRPTQDLFFSHDFGDRSAGEWTTGANTNLSKNYATGPVAAHIYETAGTYIINSTVTDGTSIAQKSNTITVANPDTTYSGTNTICIANVTATAGQGGCPAGASTPPGTVDWDVSLATCVTTTKRCLFRRGDTFIASTSGYGGTTGPTTIGAYGSGAIPSVTLSAGAGILIDDALVNDLRIMDIEFVGNSISSGTQYGINTNQNISGVTILRLTVREAGAGGINLPTICVNCIVQDSTIYNYYGAQGIFAMIESGAILGNTLGPGTSTGFQVLRLKRAQKSVVAYNTINAPLQSNYEIFAFRAEAHVTNANDSFFNVVSDNKILNGAVSCVMLEMDDGGVVDVRIYDNIIERNWYLAGATPPGVYTCYGIITAGTRTAIRNNLFDLSLAGGSNFEALRIADTANTPSPTDNTVYNNTLYSSAAKSYLGIRLGDANVTTSIVKNNLCYFPSGAGGTVCVSDSGTGTTASNNSTTPQTTGTDPQFDGPLTSPIGFRINTASYAQNAGTAIFPPSIDDFFHCDDSTANERMGAFVPRVRATCRGSAGP